MSSTQALSPVELPAGRVPIRPDALVALRTVETNASVLVAVEPAVTPTLDSSVSACVTVEPTASVALAVEPSVSAAPTLDSSVSASVSVEPTASVPVTVEHVIVQTNSIIGSPSPIVIPTVIYYPPPPVPDFTDSSAEHTPTSNEIYVSGDQTPIYC